MRNRVIVAMAFLALAATVSVAAPGDRIAEMSVGAGSLRFAPAVEFTSASLDFVGKSVSISRSFSSGAELSLELADRQGGPLADGTYNFSLVLKTSSRAEKVTDEFTDGSSMYRMTGSILIRNGVAYSEEELSATQADAELEVALAGFKSEPAVSLGLSGSPGPKDQVINDDLIVEGSVCASTNSTCVNGQAFGTTEFLALGVIPSIVLNEDFSTQGLWEFDTASGHLRFGDDRTGTIPMTLQQGAASNSLFVAASGNVGIGTAAPAVPLDVVKSTGDSRVLDITSPTAEMGIATGNVAWGFYDTDGDIPVLVQQAVTSQVLNLTNVGGQNRLGLGTPSPETSLHLVDPEPQILVQSTGAATGRTLAYLKNSGDVRFFWENTNSGDIWQMSMLSTVLQMASPTGSGKFRVRKSGGLQALNGSTEIMALNSTGDLTVKSVTQTSSREAKNGFESVDGQSVLEKVAALPISEWSYKADNPTVRHIGPMSEDFHAAFGLGKTDKGLTSIDTSGVALAAIQGLVQENKRLEERIADLEEMVQALAEH